MAKSDSPETAGTVTFGLNRVPLGTAPISTSLKLIGIGTMKEEILALKGTLKDLKEKLLEIRRYL